MHSSQLLDIVQRPWSIVLQIVHETPQMKGPIPNPNTHIRKYRRRGGFNAPQLFAHLFGRIACSIGTGSGSLVGISPAVSFEDAWIRNFDVSPSGGFVMCDYAARGEGGLLPTCELSQHGALAVKRRMDC